MHASTPSCFEYSLEVCRLGTSKIILYRNYNNKKKYPCYSTCTIILRFPPRLTSKSCSIHSSAHFRGRVPKNLTRAWKSLHNKKTTYKRLSRYSHSSTWNPNLMFNGICFHNDAFDVRQLSIMLHKRQTRNFKKLLWQQITVSHWYEKPRTWRARMKRPAFSQSLAIRGRS